MNAAAKPSASSLRRSVTGWFCSKVTPDGGEPVDLGVEHGARQAVGRDAVAHHPARLRAVVAHRDRVAEPGEVVGGRQAAGTGADDEDALACGRRGRGIRPPLLDGEVPQEALHSVDRHRAVHLGSVAHGLARVVADPAVDGGEGVVLGELAPGLLVQSLLGQPEPRLDVLARRTAGVARRQQVDVHGPLRRTRAGGGARTAADRAPSSTPGTPTRGGGRSLFHARSPWPPRCAVPAVTGIAEASTLGAFRVEDT